MLTFFDSDIGVGRTGFRIPVTSTPQETLALMDRYGIAKALVYDRGMMESGLFTQNDFILDFCRESERLLPTISVVPPATGEILPPNELIPYIREHGIKAVRVWPKVHRFDFDPGNFEPLLGLLEAHRIPVIYHSANLEDHPWEHRVEWQNIRSVAQAFPELPIIVSWMGMLEGRRFLPMLAQCPNLLLDLTCMSFQYIEYVVEIFGSTRLALASHHPIHDPGLYTTWISYSGIPQSDREAIASGNLQRLVEGIR